MMNEANISSISRAVDFIEVHLREEMTLADVADAVHYSLFHFCRMFNSVVHHTPYEYVMRRRITESAKDLVLTDSKIIEIAFEYQFNSPETYTRAFKRMFAMLPSQWRKCGALPSRALMPRLTVQHLRHLNRGTYLKPTLEMRNTMPLAGLMTRVKSFDDGAIPEIWKDVISIANRQSSIVTFYGVSWFPDKWETDGWYYLAAVDVGDWDNIPAAFVTKAVPEATYARFRHHGRRTERRLTTDYVYHTWLPKSAKLLAWPIEVEMYAAGPPSFDDEAHEWALWLPISSPEKALG